MSKTTTTGGAVKAPAPETPAVHLLPLNLGRLAEHAGDGRASRFALDGVLVEFLEGNRYAATATDTKVLVRVEGDCAAHPDEFPLSCVPALAHAPNGASKALVPARAWRESFKKAKSLTRKTRQTALRSLAVVVHEQVTTFAATDSEAAVCESTPNLTGKFAPYQDILEKTRKDGPCRLRVAVDPRMLAQLLQTAAEFAGDECHRVEFEFRFPVPEPAEGEEPAGGGRPAGGEGSAEVSAPKPPAPVQIDWPFLVRARNESGELTGLVMPLAW
jgi:hypothetical protein